MAEQPPQTSQIDSSIISRTEQELGRTTPLPSISFARIASKAASGAIGALYRFVAFIGRQVFPRTAAFGDLEFGNQIVNPLVELGVTINEGPPGEATRAELLVELTVLQQGGSLRAGAPLVGASNGVTYITLTGTLLNAPTVQVTIRAAEDQNNTGGVGTIGNLNPGDSLSLVNTPGDLQSTAIVVSQSVTAADAELEPAYRERVEFAFAVRPQGGSPRDYQLWATEPEGIVSAFPYTGTPGIVNVYILATVGSSGNPDGIPTAAQLQAALDSIYFDQDGLAGRAQITAFVNTLPITRDPYDVTVTGLNSPDPTGTQSRVSQALTAYLFNREPFIAGLSLDRRRRDQISIAGVFQVVNDVVINDGGTVQNVELFEGGGSTPIVSQNLGEGQTAKLGVLSFGS